MVRINRDKISTDNDKIKNYNSEQVYVSILIPNYNGEKILFLCFESLMKQTFSKYEIIVIDNGSTDNSVQICLQYREKGLPIKIIELKTNSGFAKAVNLGAMYAKGKYILVTNNDIIFHEKFLENIFNGLENIRQNSKEVVAASGLILHYPDKESIFYAGGAFAPVTAGYYIFYGKKLSDLTVQEKEMINSIRYIAFPSGAGALVDKEVFLRLGGYYSPYFAGIEEMDFGMQLYKNGYKAIFIPNAILYHIESYTFGKKSVLIPHKLLLILRNLLIYYFRNYNAADLVLSIFIHASISLFLITLSMLKRNKLLVYSVINAYKLFLEKDIKILRIYKQSKTSPPQKSMREIHILLNPYNAFISLKDNLRMLLIKYSVKVLKRDI